MDINEIYSSINSFWENIYPILLFHIALILIIGSLFPSFSFKGRIDNYAKSAAFGRTKALLKEYELHKGLPYLIVIVVIVYFALFNSLTTVVTSPKVFPFNFSYSATRFVSMYEPKEDIIEIASYGKDTVFAFNNVENLTGKYLEEYKVKYPERFKSYVGWNNDAFGTYMRYLRLSALMILVLAVIYIKRVRKEKGRRGALTFKIMLITFLLLIVMLGLRYKAEQAIEGRARAEIGFVKVMLSIDKDQKPLLDSAKTEKLRHQVLEYSVHHSPFTAPSFWVSDYVEQVPFFERLLGERRFTE